MKTHERKKVHEYVQKTFECDYCGEFYTHAAACEAHEKRCGCHHVWNKISLDFITYQLCLECSLCNLTTKKSISFETIEEILNKYFGD